MRIAAVLLAVFLALLYVTVRGPSSAAVKEADVVADFGEPIPGLSAGELLAFRRGKEVFERRFDRTDGLGPHFNAVSCRSCHEDPVSGGSAKRYRDFFLAGRTNPDGTVSKVVPDCTEKNAAEARDELCLPSLVIPNYGPRGTIAAPVAAGVEHPPIPEEADVVARRNAPPLFGVGLFRLVSDAEILSRADPDDTITPDGISGRVNIVPTEENAIGRFGYKCQTASIEAFNRGAFNNQLGITSDSTELVVGAARGLPETHGGLFDLLRVKEAHAQVAEPKDRITDFDGVPDPEVQRFQLLDLIAFQENLAAPPRGLITPAVTRGEAVFAATGCAKCHVPSLETPLGVIHPYTDLLIHDLGEGLSDRIVMGLASGSEFRTQPLWGLCRHAPFLHDGRADTLAEAILLHGGEASQARAAYEALDEAGRSDLHRFLESL
jgi:CxxC motif-containing protein (DUF1111 family)